MQCSVGVYTHDFNLNTVQSERKDIAFKLHSCCYTLYLASSALRWYSSALGSTGVLSKALVSTSHWAWALYRSWNSLASSNARCRKLCCCLSPPASSSSWARRASTSPPKLSAPVSFKKPAARSARSLSDFRKLCPCWSSDWRVWVKERAEIQLSMGAATVLSLFLNIKWPSTSSFSTLLS